MVLNIFSEPREEVEAMIQEDQLLEHAEYVGNYYGTSSVLCRRYAFSGEKRNP